jgi:hypothetical protein
MAKFNSASKVESRIVSSSSTTKPVHSSNLVAKSIVPKDFEVYKFKGSKIEKERIDKILVEMDADTGEIKVRYKFKGQKKSYALEDVAFDEDEAGKMAFEKAISGNKKIGNFFSKILKYKFSWART